MPDDLAELRRAYEQVKKDAKGNYGGDAVSAALLKLVELSLNFLSSECTQVPLISRVAGKKYIAYTSEGRS